MSLTGFDAIVANKYKEDIQNLGPQALGFLQDRSIKKGRELSNSVGSATGAMVGGFLGGPLGAMAGHFVGDLAGGLLFDAGQSVKRLFK